MSKATVEVFDTGLFILETRPDRGASNLEVQACSQPFSAPPPPPPPPVAAFGFSWEPTQACTQWLLIKPQTVLSCVAPVGLGRRRERARLDRSWLFVFFFFVKPARLRG